MIKGAFIFTVGVGAGFGVGYLKAGSDLDREEVHELVVIGKEFFVEASDAVRQLVVERKKQTAMFEQAAEAMAEQRTDNVKTEVDEPDEPEVDDPEQEPTS